MELFTGTQCCPCVAADVALGALAQTYEPTELALLQYHMHIPGPDPMTNLDTEARWKHYLGAFAPTKTQFGVPTAVFNGKTFRVGGGAMAAAWRSRSSTSSSIPGKIGSW